MAKLTRVSQKIFGGSGPTNEFDQIGSLAAGGAVTTKDPAVIQALANYAGGWADCILANGNPALEDMNSLDFLITRQLAYLMQAGVAEWDATTTYYIGSMVNVGGVIYVSVQDDNLNLNPAAFAGWKIFRSGSLNPQVTPALGVRAVSTWHAQSASNSNQWVQVCWSEELNLFVAIGQTGANRVMTSPNGKTWTNRVATSDNLACSCICWSPELGIFAALTGFGDYMTSPDGTTWTTDAGFPASFSAINSVCWSPELGIFVGIGFDTSSSTTKAYTSPDGSTWTKSASLSIEVPNNIIWAAELGLFVAVGAAGTNQVSTSPNGTTWTGRAPSSTSNWFSVCWSPELGLLVAVSGLGGKVMRSRDGITWTQVITDTSAWQSIAWSAQLGLFVAIANSGTNRIMTSPDGVTWTIRTAAGTETLTNVTWSPQLGYFVTVADSGTNLVSISTYVKKFIAP